MYKDEKILEKYGEVASKVISALHPKMAKSIADAHAVALVDFEKKLAAATPDAEDRDDVTVRNLSLHITLDMLTWRGRNITTLCRCRMQTL